MHKIVAIFVIVAIILLLNVSVGCLDSVSSVPISRTKAGGTIHGENFDIQLSNFRGSGTIFDFDFYLKNYGDKSIFLGETQSSYGASSSFTTDIYDNKLSDYSHQNTNWYEIQPDQSLLHHYSVETDALWNWAWHVFIYKNGKATNQYVWES